MSYIPSISWNSCDRELSLNGSGSYSINGNRVLIQIDEIANNRQSDNLSGTLAVELWALPEPYAGNQFSGVALAATTIGEIFGQYSLAQCHYDLNFNQPPTGTWTLCLMLREWENGAFVTRDYINFALPYTVESAPQSRANIRVSRGDADNVINIAFKEEPETASSKELALKENVPAEKVPAEKAPAKQAPKGMDELIAKTPAARKSTVIADTQVSINKAAQHELEALKGVSKKLAKAIVDSRPYKKLDDLLAVNGMGKKLLSKLEKSLKI